jgi:hypothetical protein
VDELLASPVDELLDEASVVELEDALVVLDEASVVELELPEAEAVSSVSDSDSESEVVLLEPPLELPDPELLAESIISSLELQPTASANIKKPSRFMPGACDRSPKNERAPEGALWLV